MKAKTQFRITHKNNQFSAINAFHNPKFGGQWGLIGTMTDAKIALEQFAECPNGTPENKAFWKARRDEAKIVRVTEIIETDTESEINYSAAPELLKALTECEQLLSIYAKSTEKSLNDCGDAAQIWSKAKKAIKKATE